jgi:hypothetical protein
MRGGFLPSFQSEAWPILRMLGIVAPLEDKVLVWAVPLATASRKIVAGIPGC